MEDKHEGGDIFAEAWEDEAGGIVADGRESEELPGRDAEAAGTPGPPAEESAADAGAAEDRMPDPGPGSPGMPDPEARDREIDAFLREYPEVTAEDIPRSVWRRVAAGESLLTAYAGYEARTLRQENAYLIRRLAGEERSRQNRERSAGSQLGAGAGKNNNRDPFDDGWDLENWR